MELKVGHTYDEVVVQTEDEAVKIVDVRVLDRVTTASGQVEFVLAVSAVAVPAGLIVEAKGGRDT